MSDDVTTITNQADTKIVWKCQSMKGKQKILRVTHHFSWHIAPFFEFFVPFFKCGRTDQSSGSNLMKAFIWINLVFTEIKRSKIIWNTFRDTQILYFHLLFSYPTTNSGPSSRGQLHSAHVNLCVLFMFDPKVTGSLVLIFFPYFPQLAKIIQFDKYHLPLPATYGTKKT